MADLAGLLGIDPELMKLLTGGAQTDSKAPLNAGLMAAGLGMLANSHKGLAGGIGEGGLLGMQAFQAEKQRQQKDPAQAIGMANALLGLQQGMAKNQWMKDFANQAGQGPDGQAGQGMAIAGPPTASVQQQQPAAGGSMPLTRIIQGMMLGMPGAKELYDKSTAAPVKFGPGDIPATLNPMTGQWERGQQIPNLDRNMTTDPATGRAIPFPGTPDAVGALAGATTGAQESAKAAYDLVDVPDGLNGKVQMTRADAVRRMGQQAPQAQAGPDSQVMAAYVDWQNSGRPGGAFKYTPPPQQGQLGRTPSAADTAAATQAATMPGDLSKTLAADAYKAQLGDLKESWKAANLAQSAVGSINESRAALADPVLVGGMAKDKAAALRMVNGLLPSTLQIAPELLGNSERLASSLGNALVEHAKALGSNPSNADAKRLEKVIGDEGLSEKGIRAILDFQERQARNAIDKHNTIAKQASDKGATPLFDYQVKAPEPYGAKQGGGDKPPAPGAQKAPDGKWYIKSGSKFYRVDQ